MNVLISYIGCEYYESFSLRCCVINRVLHLLGVEFKTQIFEIEADSLKLKERYTQFPILICGGKKFVGYFAILKYLKLKYSKHELFSVAPRNKILNQHLQEWCNFSLKESYYYFNYKYEPGFKFKNKLFYKAYEEQDYPYATVENLSTTGRSFILNELLGKTIDGLDEKEAFHYLENQLLYVEDLLSNSKYICGEELRFVDVVLFSIMVRFFCPGITLLEKLPNRYPKILRWLKSVASETDGPENVTPEFLRA